MISISYFRFLCFLWATVGISSRIAMAVMGENWKKWELDNAYTKEKPKWVYGAAIIAYLLVGYTWYMVFRTDVNYSWIIGVLVTLSIVKVSAVVFKYNSFRKFVVSTLENKNKMRQLNIAVIVFSFILILLGILLY